MDLLQKLLMSSSNIEFLELDASGRIVDANSAFLEHVGEPSGKGRRRLAGEVLVEADRDRLEEWIGDGELPESRVRLNFVTSRGTAYSLICLLHRHGEGIQIIGEPERENERTAAEDLVRLNNELATLARERARQQRELARTRDELEAALADLKNSYWHLQKIQEVMPLCMRCNKVKADGAAWQSVIEYLKDNEIFLSHGYCPECAAAVEREYGLTDEEEERQ